MGESRAADYIAFGMNRGVDRFLDGIEKRKEEEKNNAKKFKALASYAEAAGLLTKDQAAVMDVESLDGFVKAKMWAKEQEQQDSEQQLRMAQFEAINQHRQQESQLAQLAQMQKMEQDSALAGYANQGMNSITMGYSPNLGDYYENPENYQQRPPMDYPAALGSALSMYPQAAGDERFGAVRSMLSEFAPPDAKQYVPTEISKKLTELRKAKAEGRTDDAKILEADIQKDITPSGMRLEVGKDGSIIFSQGSGDLTTATKGQVQQRLIATQKAADMASELTQILRPENVGVAGWGQQVIVDEKLAQMFPELANAQNVDSRTLMGVFAEGMLRTLKADAMINQKEEARILGLMPSRDPLKESFPSAMAKLGRVMKELRRIAQTDAEASKVDVPKWALDPEDIQALVKSGKMPVAEGRELIKRYHPFFTAQSTQ